MTLKPFPGLFTERPPATPIPADIVRFNRTNEFSDLETEVGRHINAAIAAFEEGAA